MQLRNTETRYGAVPQTLHWLTALAVICGFLLGQFGDFLPRGPVRATGLLVHMTLGECVIALLIARLLWRIVDPPPPPEATPFGRLVTVGAKLSHFALYALLLAVPCVGILVQLERGRALPILALWQANSPWAADRETARTVLHLHYYLACTLLVLAFVHSCAAIIHHSVWRDRTLKRMLPGAA